MSAPDSSTLNNTSKAVCAVAEVAKLILQPVCTYAQAHADAYRVRKLAMTETEMEALRQRAKLSQEAELLRYQINKECILKKAEGFLSSQEKANQLPSTLTADQVEEDWLWRWASLAKEASVEEVQCLWAKVLAGELVKPGKFSLRLLATLHTLRRADALAFEKFANYVWEGPGGTWFQLYTPGTEDLLQKHKDMGYEFYSHLQSLGLVDANTQIGIKVRKESPLTALYGGTSYSFTTQRSTASPIKVRLLTSTGAELFGLCEPRPDAEYLKQLSDWAIDNGVVVAWLAATSFSEDFVRSQPKPAFEPEPPSDPVWLP